MSLQVNQFLSIIREANEKRSAAQAAVVYLFCAHCGAERAHVVTTEGQWERFTCDTCKHSECYRVG